MMYYTIDGHMEGTSDIMIQHSIRGKLSLYELPACLVSRFAIFAIV